MVIQQGDIFWISLPAPTRSEPGYRHPFVIIQNNVANFSKINTTIVCLITSNLKRANVPGNVLIHKNEGNLEKKCVVNVSQVYTVDKLQLKKKIGELSGKKINQILYGLNLFLQPQTL